MDRLATNGEIMANAGMYFIITVAVCMVLDLYAKKKLGVRALGYKILRIPRLASLGVASLITIAAIAATNYFGWQIKYTTLTYMGLPYFVIWIFFMVNVLRRVRAETKGRPGM